ncbi:Vitelline membrane outer layer protein 1 [Mactra antiquata]
MQTPNNALNMISSFGNSALIILVVVSAANAAVSFQSKQSDSDRSRLDDPEKDVLMIINEDPSDNLPADRDVKIDSSKENSDDTEAVIDPTIIREGALDIEGKVFDRNRVTMVLKVTNGGPVGTWGEASLCPKDSFGAGYDMKIEPDQGHFRDDTSLNAIKIVCKGLDGDIRGYGASKVGPLGSYVGDTYCHSSSSRTDFLTAFKLQVQPRVLLGNTAANYAAFKCRNLHSSNAKEYEIVKSPGKGLWGTWGSWSSSCPKESAICGIKTRVEAPQGFLRDDSALNDAIFYCCDF